METIKWSRPSSAPCEDVLINKILKNSPSFKLKIFRLFNLSIKYGYIPQKWKIAKIIMIPKKRKPTEHTGSFLKILQINHWKFQQKTDNRCDFLEKAFDKISHKAIHTKLKSINLNYYLYNWISNFMLCTTKWYLAILIFQLGSLEAAACPLLFFLSSSMIS